MEKMVDCEERETDERKKEGGKEQRNQKGAEDWLRGVQEGCIKRKKVLVKWRKENEN